MLLNCGIGEDSWESLGLPRRSNPSILKKINPKYSLERLILKLKLQYFGHLMQNADPLEKTKMQRKIEGKRRRGWQKISLDGITDSIDMNLSKLWEIIKDSKALTCCSPCGHSQTQLSIWTEQALGYQFVRRQTRTEVQWVVKNLLVIAGDVRNVVWSLGEEDPMEEEMAIHSSILAWEIPWTEASGGP